MKVAQLLEQRRKNWQELERLCAQMSSGGRKSLGPAGLSRFASLYRAACADLALADAYQLPPSTIQYLHRLVGQAHNQLYRSRTFEFSKWWKVLMVDVPREVFHDRCVQVMFCVFYGFFILSAFVAYRQDLWPDYVDNIVTAELVAQVEEMYNSPPTSGDSPMAGTGFYLWHNTSIGLQCFAGGLLVVPGLIIVLFNAVFLGAIFGYMARPEVTQTAHFFEFVTAHGPFELTAIVLSAGAGLRLGLAWIATGGRSRLDSLRQTAYRAMPIMGSAIVLFALAALTEAALSPTPAPYWVKAGMAIVSSGLLMFYFLVLGYPRRAAEPTAN